MKDLLVNFLGAIVFSVIGYVSLKTNRNSPIAESLMVKPVSESQHKAEEEEIRRKELLRREKRKKRKRK